MYEKEVVRCKNCAYWVQDDENFKDDWGRCKGLLMKGIKIDIVVAGGYSAPDVIYTNERFFCSVAVRRRT